MTRIAGEVDLDAQGNVDGKLKLGLPSAVTAKWPQLQTSVFPTQSDDYNWTDVHLTGTPDHLQEDLTPRLLAAGLNQGGSILNKPRKRRATCSTACSANNTVVTSQLVVGSLV